MKRIVVVLILLVILGNFSFSQSKREIDSLLTSLCNNGNSKKISTSINGKKIISFGRRILPQLSIYFTDTTLTQVKSDCQNVWLHKGEVAIILADRIEIMPYMKLTGIQNCTMDFCKDNPNLIEYYLSAIRRDGAKSFQKNYKEWLISKERKQWP